MNIFELGGLVLVLAAIYLVALSLSYVFGVNKWLLFVVMLSLAVSWLIRKRMQYKKEHEENDEK